MADEELELDSEGDSCTGHGGRTVKKNIAIKLKQPPKPRGRPKKSDKTPPKPKKVEVVEEKDDFGDDELIEPPIFKQGPGEPLHQNGHLKWNHKVNLIGEKVLDPLIHCCEICHVPILLYGRMIPCKHVFCLDCARKTEKKCSRCEEPVQRIEQSALGTVYVCSYGGDKHGASGCRRTYLSQRDLQAHIHHRHLKEAGEPARSSSSSKDSVKAPVKSSSQLDLYTSARPDGDSGSRPLQGEIFPRRSEEGRINPSQPLVPTHLPPPVLAHNLGPMHQPPPVVSQSLQPPPTQGQIDNFPGSMGMMQGRSNLISIPIQEDTDFRRQAYMTPPMSMPVTFPTSLPPPGMPPPRFSQPSSMTPSMLQGPPPVSFSGPQVNLGPMRFSSPPISSSSGLMSMSQPPPPIRAGGPPLHMNIPTSLGPPQRFPNPRGHFDDSSNKPPFGQPPGQGARVPWPGPPPQSQGGGPLGPQQQRPQTDYNRYY